MRERRWESREKNMKKGRKDKRKEEDCLWCDSSRNLATALILFLHAFSTESMREEKRKGKRGKRGKGEK